jgi:hypothetical protein
VRTRITGAWPIWVGIGIGVAIATSSVVAAGSFASMGDTGGAVRRIAVATAVLAIAICLLGVVLVPRLIAGRRVKAFLRHNPVAVTALFSTAPEDPGSRGILQSLVPGALLASPSEIELVGPTGSRIAMPWSEVQKMWLTDDSSDGTVREPILHIRWAGGSPSLRLINPRIGRTLTPDPGYAQRLLRSLVELAPNSTKLTGRPWRDLGAF